jgi:hypothetical protein
MAWRDSRRLTSTDIKKAYENVFSEIGSLIDEQLKAVKARKRKAKVTLEIMK